MRLVIGILAGLIALFLPLTALSLGVVTTEQKRALEIQEALLNRQYADAEAILKSLKLPATSPLPTLVRMTAEELKMTENLDFSKPEPFLAQSDPNESLCEKLIEDAKTDPWRLLLCGASDAMRGLFYVRGGKTFRALGYVRRAMKTFDLVREKDPGNVDATLAAAAYDFFKSHFLETKLSFLPFFPDKRKESLEKIKLVAQHGVFARDLADFCLALLAMEAPRKDVGMDIFPKMLGRFPNSIVLRTMNAAFLIKVRKHAEARVALHEMMRLDPKITVAKYFMGRSFALEGKDLESARKWLTEFIATNPDPSVKGPAYYLLGLAAEKEGKSKDAIKLYQTAYDTYPRYKPALKNLQRLKESLRDA